MQGSVSLRFCEHVFLVIYAGNAFVCAVTTDAIHLQVIIIMPTIRPNSMIVRMIFFIQKFDEQEVNMS